eukprot:scaffold61976_cov35-Cyclotella_meneghiniana.AAC.6
MTEEGPKAKPENIPLSGLGRRINGSCKALQPQMQLESREWRWMESWLWAAVVIAAACSGWKNTEPNTARKPPHFLLRIEEVLLGICSRYFLLTCHDVKTKYRAKYRGKYRDKIS